MAHSTLDHVDQIVRTTEKAVLVRFTDGTPETWISRSVCEDGDDLDVGDEDLVVLNWFIAREGLN